MKKSREVPMTKEEKRLEQLRFIMEHWDDLPENLQCRFEGIATTARDFLSRESG